MSANKIQSITKFHKPFITAGGCRAACQPRKEHVQSGRRTQGHRRSATASTGTAVTPRMAWITVASDKEPGFPGRLEQGVGDPWLVGWWKADALSLRPLGCIPGCTCVWLHTTAEHICARTHTNACWRTPAHIYMHSNTLAHSQHAQMHTNARICTETHARAHEHSIQLTLV